jgi:hypothetical protein
MAAAMRLRKINGRSNESKKTPPRRHLKEAMMGLRKIDCNSNEGEEPAVNFSIAGAKAYSKYRYWSGEAGFNIPADGL